MMKLTFSSSVAFITGIALLTTAACVKKDRSNPEEGSYEKNKAVYEQLDSEIFTGNPVMVKKGLFLYSPSYSSGATAPVPIASTFYYCGNTASPWGSMYVRFHYQVDFDANTKKAIRFDDKRIELRFFGANFGTSGNDSKVYLGSAGSWPRCVYVDRLATEMAIPNYMVAGIVSSTGVSSYTLTANGPYMSQPGWNGIINFSTPPTYAISQGNYIVAHPDGPGAACP